MSTVARTRLRRSLVLVIVVALGVVGVVLALQPRPDQVPLRGPVLPPPAVPVDAAVLVGAGDIATCEGSADEATAALLEGIPGTVFAAGDLAYPDGSSRDFASCYDPSWGRLRDRTRPAIGNHELDTDLLGAPYHAYFGAVAGAPGEAWSTFEVGTWRVVVLDSNCDRVDCGNGSPQVQWLEQTLRDHPARCLAAIWHHPRFSSGEHGDDARLIPIWQVLQDAGAELVIVGHDHDYERFAPMRADGTLDAAGGIREFVVGTGGAGFRPVGDTRPNSEVHQSDSHGVLRLALRPDAYDWAFIPIPGDTFTDAGSDTCH